MTMSFPYRFDERGRTATSVADQHVRELIEQLVLTSPGERVMRPDFGTGLAQLVFAPGGPELAASLQYLVQSAVQGSLADEIAVDDVTVEALDSTVEVTVAYTVRTTALAQTTTVSIGGAP
jgi:uncharacterized protein